MESPPILSSLRDRLPSSRDKFPRGTSPELSWSADPVDRVLGGGVPCGRLESPRGDLDEGPVDLWTLACALGRGDLPARATRRQCLHYIRQ